MSSQYRLEHGQVFELTIKLVNNTNTTPFQLNLIGKTELTIGRQDQEAETSSPFVDFSNIVGPTHDFVPIGLQDVHEPEVQARPKHHYINIHSSNSRQWSGVIATLDTGTDENWISQKIVERLGLPVTKGLTTQWTTFNGETFSSEEIVRPTWSLEGHGVSHVAAFRVAPEAPFDVLFGRNFVNSQINFFENNTQPNLSNNQDRGTIYIEPRMEPGEAERMTNAKERAYMKEILRQEARLRASGRQNSSAPQQGTQQGSSKKKEDKCRIIL